MLINLRTCLQVPLNAEAFDMNEDVSSPSIHDADQALPLSARVRLYLLVTLPVGNPLIIAGR